MPLFAIGPLCCMIPILMGVAVVFYLLTEAWKTPPPPPPQYDPDGVPTAWPTHWPR